MQRAIVQSSPTTFHGIDSEGSGDGEAHRLVLIRSGDKSIKNAFGFTWEEIFEFLYSTFKPGPRDAYVGFYLGYDFTQWLKTLPARVAWELLSPEGIAQRQRKKSGGNHTPFPVRYLGWEFDILGMKRLKIRPRGSKLPWMNICDTGGFFQSSFLTAIDPAKWPEGSAVVTPEEFQEIKTGKEHRSEAYLDEEMEYYNWLECSVLERLMASLENGLISMGIRLTPAQWFGPGQVAQAWLKDVGAVSTLDLDALVRAYPTDDFAYFREAAKDSYFGGWFEIFAHGIIPGTSYSYDINSAYPYVISRLPCLRHGRFYRGTGEPSHGGNTLRLVYASVFTKQQGEEGEPHNLGYHAIGAMLHRDKNGQIARPFATKGWYWLHELDAAIAAKTVNHVQYHNWYAYDPCDCEPPLATVADLYLQRLTIDKKSPLGKAIKLLINSIYGKFAQSVGNPTYGNPIYASLITAGCRTMILNAIATHPEGQRNVVMVATDGVYFLDRHPTLPLSSALGDWEESTHDNLCLFKPGMYWDDSDRALIEAGEAPQFKARGIRSRDFATHIADIDAQFRTWPKLSKKRNDYGTYASDMTARSQWKKKGSGWPHKKVTLSFSMVSITQAIQPGWDWGKAGTVSAEVTVEQSSWNGAKRDGLWYDPERDIYRSKPIGDNWLIWPPTSQPYEKRFGMDDPWSEESVNSNGITPDGPVNTIIKRVTRPE
jgi:hypothetical protein